MIKLTLLINLIIMQNIKDKNLFIFKNIGIYLIIIFVFSLFFRINDLVLFSYVLKTNFLWPLGVLNSIFMPLSIKFQYIYILDYILITFNFIILYFIYRLFYIKEFIKWGYIFNFIYTILSLTIWYFFQIIIFAT